MESGTDHSRINHHQNNDHDHNSETPDHHSDDHEHHSDDHEHHSDDHDQHGHGHSHDHNDDLNSSEGADLENEIKNIYKLLDDDHHETEESHNSE